MALNGDEMTSYEIIPGLFVGSNRCTRENIICRIDASGVKKWSPDEWLNLDGDYVVPIRGSFQMVASQNFTSSTNPITIKLNGNTILTTDATEVCQFTTILTTFNMNDVIRIERTGNGIETSVVCQVLYNCFAS